MTQNELNRAVARATGESHGTIRDLGFTLVTEETEPATEPTLAVDCPGCGARLEVHSCDPRRGQVECPRCDAVYPYSVQEIYVSDTPGTPLAACA
jgi:hypothetical protein